MRMITIQTAIFSHLSDAQEAMGFGDLAKANLHINFAKKLLVEYPDTFESISIEELDMIWNEILP